VSFSYDTGDSSKHREDVRKVTRTAYSWDVAQLLYSWDVAQLLYSWDVVQLVNEVQPTAADATGPRVGLARSDFCW